MFNTHNLTAAIGTTLGVALVTMSPSMAATFRYTTLTTQTVYTEGPTVIAGTPYDGTFVNNIFNPFSGLAQTFSGFYRIQTGTLGEAVSLNAVQQRPTDRTDLGDIGITRIEYFATPQPVAAIPGAFTVPPGLTEFDFQFVPAAVAGAPVVLSQGWSAESVPESSSPLMWAGFVGLGLGLKGLLFNATKP